MTPPRHKWMIVAPGYAIGSGKSARASVPIIQKYDTSDLVNAFLKDPTKSMAFDDADDGEDLVHRVQQSTRVNKFFNLDYVATRTRKLFLDTHKRFYLVVCEVHCDAFGFPRVDRDAICEAGFVVRRYAWRFSSDAVAKAFADERSDGFGGLVELRGSALARGATEVVQRWQPDPKTDGTGAWTEVTSDSNVPDEAVYPLYPLIPDPAKTDHPGAGRTIYFGLVPTASTELDRIGQARFDDQDVYEVRTFVRQHHFPCPKKGTRRDCPGPLVWSQPAEPYQIAPTFDLIGTSYRTINVKMPHLKTLRAQAARPKIGLRAPVRFNLPANSGVEVSAPSLPIPGGPKLMSGICFRNIPLTTIVAMFAYNILKPIVVNIFRLYYLEPLEFCIPSAPAAEVASVPPVPPKPPLPMVEVPSPPGVFAETPGGPRFELGKELKDLKVDEDTVTLEDVANKRAEAVA